MARRRARGLSLKSRALFLCLFLFVVSRLLFVVVVEYLAFDGREPDRSWGRGEAYRLYLDRRQPVEHRVRDLLSRMTLSEKVGQMTQTERAVTSPSTIRTFGLGA
jgi:hypothetical protein